MSRAKRMSIREVQHAIETESGGLHNIDKMARKAARRPHYFTRVFTDEVDESPGQYVERIRTDAARRQVEESGNTVVTIASCYGFGTAEIMWSNFIRLFGIPPDKHCTTFT